MKRTPEEAARFLKILVEMASFFSGKLSEFEQRTYLKIFDAVPLDAWEYACEKAMAFHEYRSVPLPGNIWPYINEYVARHRRQVPALPPAVRPFVPLQPHELAEQARALVASIGAGMEMPVSRERLMLQLEQTDPKTGKRKDADVL